MIIVCIGRKNNPDVAYYWGMKMVVWHLKSVIYKKYDDSEIKTRINSVVGRLQLYAID